MTDAGAPDLSGRRVLVVEDEYLTADEICSALAASGAHVIGPAPSLAQAQQLLGVEHIDCAVLDVNLRGDPVFPFADQLRGNSVPIVFATGYDPSAIAERHGACDHLLKPLDLAALLSAVAQACSRP
ncbi:MAG: response regulator [Rhizorhabdus sp.]